MKEIADYAEELGPAHAQAVEEILLKLGARPEGLSGSEVDGRLQAIGLNKLPEGKKENLFIRFFKHFNDTLIYVLKRRRFSSMESMSADTISCGNILALAPIPKKEKPTSRLSRFSRSPLAWP